MLTGNPERQRLKPAFLFGLYVTAEQAAEKVDSERVLRFMGYDFGRFVGHAFRHHIKAMRPSGVLTLKVNGALFPQKNEPLIP